MTVCEAYAAGFLTAPMIALLIYLIRNIDKNPEAW